MIALVAGYAAWQLRDFLADWWGSWRKRPQPETESAEETVPAASGPDFREFANPFTSGLAAKLTTAELVRYTFEAVEAWARQLGRPRLQQQTPSEFARGLIGPNHPLSKNLNGLADLYNQLAYGVAKLPPKAADTVRGVWDSLRPAS
jgi:hypothetical protein